MTGTLGATADCLAGALAAWLYRSLPGVHEGKSVPQRGGYLMGRQALSRRGILGAGALTLAGATLGTLAPGHALAGPPDAGAINKDTWLNIIIAQGLNGGNTSVIDAHTTPDLVDHQQYGINFPSGPAGIKALVVVLHTAFPDFHIDVQDIVTSGDFLWGRAVSTGTFTGNYLGIPGTGGKISINVMDEFRFEHLSPSQLALGQRPRAVEHWGVIDNLVLFLEMELFNPANLPNIDPSKLPVYHP